MTHSYPWTDDQDALIRKLHGENASTQAIADALGGMNRATVRRRIAKLGLKVPNIKRDRKWTPEMDAILRRYIDTESRDKIAARLGMGMTARAVIGRSHRLNIQPRSSNVSRQWTDEEVNYLRANLDTMSMGAMGRKLDRSTSAVSLKLTALGIKPAQPVRPQVSYLTPKKTKATEVIPLTARPWLTRTNRECKYLYGERHAYLACCAPVWMETGHCETHAALCGGYRRVAA